MTILQRIFIAPGEGRLRSGWRLLAHFFLLGLLLWLVAAIFVSLAALSPMLAFLGDFTFIGFVVITFSVYLARHWYDRRSFRSLGLVWDNAAGRDLLVGILIAAALMAFVFALEWALGWLTFSGFAVATKGQLAANIGYWACAFVLVGWYEELLFRGYWLHNLKDGLGLQLALFVSSAIFALAHISNPNVSWVAVLGLFLAGYFLAYAYVRTGQLWLSIGLHIGWNFFEGPIFSFPVSGLDSAKLLNIQVHGPEFITGGAFGPEAGLIIVPALFVGAVLIYTYTRATKPEARKLTP